MDSVAFFRTSLVRDEPAGHCRIAESYQVSAVDRAHVLRALGITS
jgi:hypothetical protein